VPTALRAPPHPCPLLLPSQASSPLLLLSQASSPLFLPSQASSPPVAAIPDVGGTGEVSARQLHRACLARQALRSFAVGSTSDSDGAQLPGAAKPYPATPTMVITATGAPSLPLRLGTLGLQYPTGRCPEAGAHCAPCGSCCSESWRRLPASEAPAGTTAPGSASPSPGLCPAAEPALSSSCASQRRVVGSSCTRHPTAGGCTQSPGRQGTVARRRESLKGGRCCEWGGA